MGAANAGMAETAEQARPMLLSLRRSRRAESKVFITSAMLSEPMDGLEPECHLLRKRVIWQRIMEWQQGIARIECWG